MLESLTPGFDAWRQPESPEDAQRRAFHASTRAMAALIECRRDGLIAAAADEVTDGGVIIEDAADEVVASWEQVYSRLTVDAWKLLRILIRSEIMAITLFRGRPERGRA